MNAKIKIDWDWETIGDISFDSQYGKLIFPMVSEEGSVYRILIESHVKKECYIGETNNLQRRFEQYQSPGPSQKTNIRLSQLMFDGLKKGRIIGVQRMKSIAVSVDRVSVDVDFMDKEMRRLLESAAIIYAKRDNLYLLNL